MRYDKAVREMLVDAVNDLPALFTRAEVVTWFKTNYPSVKDSTVAAYITAGTVNSRSRHQYPGADQLLIYKRSDGYLERYELSRHGQWDKWGRRIKASADHLGGGRARCVGMTGTDDHCWQGPEQDP